MWLFTKPRRSLATSDEEELLTHATSSYLAHGNEELNVMAWGNGPTVLCVHGWSSRGLRFLPLIRSLSEVGYRVVVFDAPAHGRSSGSQVDLMEFAEAVHAVAKSIGPIDALVAHSFGAAASLHALERGLECKKVVFLSGLNGLRGPLDYMAKRRRIPARKTLVFSRPLVPGTGR